MRDRITLQDQARPLSGRLGSTFRTVDLGTTCNCFRGRRQTIAGPDVRSLSLDTGQGGDVSLHLRIVAPRDVRRNGTDGWSVIRDQWPEIEILCSLRLFRTSILARNTPHPPNEFVKV